MKYTCNWKHWVGNMTQHARTKIAAIQFRIGKLKTDGVFCVCVRLGGHEHDCFNVSTSNNTSQCTLKADMRSKSSVANTCITITINIFMCFTLFVCHWAFPLLSCLTPDWNIRTNDSRLASSNTTNVGYLFWPFFLTLIIFSRATP